MKIVRRVGFFCRLPPVDKIHVIRCLARDQGIKEEGAILNYLGTGLVLGAAPGVEQDELLPNCPIIGSPDILTDGIYAWPRTLIYWVSKYHIALPEGFLEHLRVLSWTLPKTINISELVLEP